MNLDRLERLRLVRTRRIWILVGVYGFFGILGPVTARFLPELLSGLGEGVAVELPPPTPVDGIAQFNGNAQQLGLLAAVFVAAAAIGFDAKRGMAVFLRTRASVPELLRPRLVWSWLGAVVGYTAGALAAWVLTGLLLGWISLGGYLTGLALEALYLAFAVAMVLLASSFVRSVPAAGGVALGILILLGVGSLYRPVGVWLPSALAGSIDAVVREGAAGYWRSVVVTIGAIAATWPFAVRRLAGREI